MTMTSRFLSPVQQQLDNGMTIIAEQMPVNAVCFSLWIAAGSTREPDNINGMAHFLEHMVFKGSSTLLPGEFERQVEQRGGVANAMTSQDYTCFYVTTAPQDFAAIAPLQIELVLRPNFRTSEFEQERFVILEEIRRAEDLVHRRVYQNAMEVAYDRLPYRRPVIGHPEIISSIQPFQMRQFHQTWYGPENITAVAVGNLPAEDIIDTLVPQFEALPPGPGFSDSRDLSPEPAYSTIQRREHFEPRLQEARMVLMWRVPGIDQVAESDALDVVARVLGSGRTSRLVRDLREERQWVSQISVSNLTQVLQGLFWISVQLPADRIADVETAILEHVHRLQTDLIASRELDQIQRQTLNRHTFEHETPANRAAFFGYTTAIAHDLALSLNYVERIQAIGLADVQAAAQRYLSLDAYRVLIAYPESG